MNRENVKSPLKFKYTFEQIIVILGIVFFLLPIFMIVEMIWYLDHLFLKNEIGLKKSPFEGGKGDVIFFDSFLIWNKLKIIPVIL